MASSPERLPPATSTIRQWRRSWTPKAICAYSIWGPGSTWRSSGVTLSASWTKQGRQSGRLVGWVARLPARVQTKLLVAFLSIVGLLIVMGAVSLQVLGGVNDQTNELIRLERKIAAYRQ